MSAASMAWVGPLQAPELDDLLRAGYRPRAIRFWLRHWLELKTLEEDWPGGERLAQALAREWSLLRRRRAEGWRPVRERRASCLCEEMHARGVMVAVAPRASRSAGDARVALKGLAADLERAADSLPTPWRGTEAVFAQQQRRSVWLERCRRGMQGGGRPGVDDRPEPAGSYSAAVRAMAALLDPESAGGEEVPS